MPVSSVISAQRSQVVANLSVLTEGHTASIVNFRIKPRIGAAQTLDMILNIDGITDLELEVTLHDPAFEEHNLFGGRKGRGPSSEGELSRGAQI